MTGIQPKQESILKINKHLRAFAIVSGVLFVTQAQAFDFGKLLNQIADGLPKDQTNQASTGKTQSSGFSLTENYCRRTFSTAGLLGKKSFDKSLVLEEFNFKTPDDFFDAFVQARFQPSFTFPTTNFYQGEFETDRINVLFDLLLSYPSATYLAALISEAKKVNGSPQYDHQAKVDAVAALTIMHYMMQPYSKIPDRWKELAAQLQLEEHYTARVISARLLASGELGIRDPDRALSFANDANGLRNKYQSENGMRTMSSRNYSVTSNRTLYDIVMANPRIPQARYYVQFAQQYGATLKNPILAPELESQLGPGLKSIEKSSEQAASKARDLLKGAQKVALLKAEKTSLDNATRNRLTDTPADINIDHKTMLSLTRQLEQLNTLDEQQKKQFASALEDARNSGDKAIAMMPLLASSMLNLMMQRGITAMPAMEPYAKKFQHYSDNSCSVFARWEQAAQVTQAKNDDARSSLAGLMDSSNN